MCILNVYRSHAWTFHGCNWEQLLDQWEALNWSVNIFLQIFKSLSRPNCKSFKELKFWENVHPPPCILCHMSYVTCHMLCVICHVSCVTYHVSHVMCHMSHVLCHMLHFSSSFLLDKMMKLVGRGSVINRAYLD